MADYTFSTLTSAVAGFSTTSFDSDFISNSLITENLICYLDSSIESSYSGTGSNWFDLSRTENNAILSGNYSYSDYSLIFANGGKATITNNSSFNFSGDFSIECYIYMTNSPDNLFPSALVSSWGEFGSIDNKFILFINSSGNLVFQANGESNQLTHPSTINLNQWYHIVVSRIDGVVNLYVNGVKGSSLSYPSSITPSLDILIATYSAADDNYSFQGKLPLVRVYNGRGLNENEVVRNSRTISISPSLGSISVGNMDFSNINQTVPGWLTGRRPVDGQVFPRGVYNK